MRKLNLTFLIFSFLFVTSALVAQTDIFKRSAIIPVDSLDVGGYGGVISGVDFDGDGNMEIYAVNNDWSDEAGKDWIPRIYKYENDGSGWKVVWSTELSLKAQNTWPALTYGDWDGDGKMEIIFGPVNNFGAGDSIYTRLVDFETKGDGSDVMGIDNGDGTFSPNASFTINDTPNYNLRPFRWHLTDIDSDGQLEIVFGARAGDERFGVISVDNIPDNGDGSETFTLEESGLDTTLTIGSGTIYDCSVMDSIIVLYHTDGSITPIVYTGGQYVSYPIVENAVAGDGPWKSSSVVDIDGDGTKEIIVNNFGSASPTTHLLQWTGDTFTSTMIADLSPYVGPGGRLYGGDTGDLDGDGNLDYVFGTRNATPNASIYRVEYQGGDITDPANYYISRIDEMLFASGGRYDVISIGNLDDDPEPEIVYTGIPATEPVPLVVLDMVPVTDLMTIAQAKVDDDGDYVPDMLGQSVTISGVVLNKSLDANSMQVFIQDPTGGIQLYSNGNPGPDLNVGDRVVATGTVDQYNGLNELSVADPSTDIMMVDSGRVVLPTELTIDDYMANAEMYEGTLIQINGVATTEGSDAWPASGSNANLTVWTGYGTELTARIDKDTDVDDSMEVAWPANLVGVSTQYDGNTPPSGGYQITLLNYSDQTQDVQVAPLPYFSLLSPEDNAVVSITDSTASYDISWQSATDLNDDVSAYNFILLPDLFESGTTDTMVSVSAMDILGLLDGADSMTVSWTVLVLDGENNLTASMDTFMVTFKNDIVTTGVNEAIPTKFYVDQNYPNPFNPTTTISFGLPAQSNVDLRVYDILGREVATIVNNKTLKAGSYNFNFNASQLASGTYIYRLTSGNNVVTKKMLLLK